MSGELVFGFISIFLAFVIAIISWRKMKKLKKYYDTLTNELIYSADFNGLKRIETIANNYKEFNKENKKECSKLQLQICCNILDKVNFVKSMRTTSLASIQQEAQTIENQQVVEEIQSETKKAKKTKKEV